MAIQLSTTLKGFFNAGDVPTESNFADVIDTIRKPVVAIAATTFAPTVTQDGSIFTANVDGSALVITLPTCAVGLTYEFLIITTQSAGTTSITTASADKLYGSVLRTVDGLSATHDATHTQVDSNTGVNDNTFTMNATTQGGIIGTRIKVIGMKANAWYITGTNIGSGTQITCFS